MPINCKGSDLRFVSHPTANVKRGGAEMARFSVLGRKRRAVHPPSASGEPSSSGDEDEEEEEEEEEEEVEGLGSRFGVGEEDKASIAVTIDPDVLDCSICFEPLAPPIFQCENGHVACASCCSKLKKCHSCSCSIGHNRCLALEKVLESVRIPCPHAYNGCKEIIIYAQSAAHKELCSYSPCFCPFPDCKFDGCIYQLALHFSSEHDGFAVRFQYDDSFTLSLDQNKSMQTLLAEDGFLYVLHNNRILSVGNSITLTCIRPSMQNGGISYELTARSGESSLRLAASMLSTKKWLGVSPSEEFLLVPHNFFDAQGKLNLEVCVRRMHN